jgi:mRNA-degrading endonuclease toxin of MazEF toxin-antitoxin module
MAAFPRRGEIWLVDFPDDPKSRPALIVSLNSRNEFSNSVLAVPVTGPLGGTISAALMREVERCLLRSLGLAG